MLFLKDLAIGLLVDGLSGLLVLQESVVVGLGVGGDAQVDSVGVGGGHGGGRSSHRSDGNSAIHCAVQVRSGEGHQFAIRILRTVITRHSSTQCPSYSRYFQVLHGL